MDKAQKGAVKTQTDTNVDTKQIASYLLYRLQCDSPTTCDDRLIFETMDEFFGSRLKAEEEVVRVTTATDDNAESGKQIL